MRISSHERANEDEAPFLLKIEFSFWMRNKGVVWFVERTVFHSSKVISLRVFLLVFSRETFILDVENHY